MQDNVDDDSQYDADYQSGDDGGIERRVVLLHKDIVRQLAQEGDVLGEDRQQLYHDDYAAEYKQYFTDSD